MSYEKRKGFIVNFIYLAIIIFIVTVVIRYGLGLVAPFLAAFLIAYFLKSLAKKITSKTNLPYKPVVLALVLLFYGTIGILISLLIIKVFTSSIDIVTALPEVYKNDIEPELGEIFLSIEKLFFNMDADIISTVNDLFMEFIKSLGELVTSVSVKAVGAASGYASSLPGTFIKIVLMIISTFFIAGDYDMLMDFVTRQLSKEMHSLLLRVKEYVVGTLFVCIRSYALIMTITFVELSIGFTIIGIDKAVLIALGISIFDILPVLGTGGIMIPWIIIEAVQGEFAMAIALLVVYLVVTVIRNILEPKIVGSQIGLHPVVTLASMFIGTQLFGVIGLFGLPIFLSLLKHLNDTNTIKIFK